MLVVGLTGGIGCGKTAVSGLFASLGVPVIDADQLSRELTQPGTAGLQAIVDSFGGDVLTSSGTLDRAILRQRIFSDPDQRALLESILHPAIRREMQRRLSALQAPYAIVVIPLLVETGQQALVDRILVIDTSPELQRQRVLARDRISSRQLDDILAAQAGREQRLAVADDVLENNGDLDELKAAVERLHRDYLALSRGEAFTHPRA